MISHTNLKLLPKWAFTILIACPADVEKYFWCANKKEVVILACRWNLISTCSMRIMIWSPP